MRLCGIGERIDNGAMEESRNRATCISLIYFQQNCQLNFKMIIFSTNYSEKL